MAGTKVIIVGALRYSLEGGLTYSIVTPHKGAPPKESWFEVRFNARG